MLTVPYPAGKSGEIITSFARGRYFKTPPLLDPKAPCADLHSRLAADSDPSVLMYSYKKGAGGPRGTAAGGPGWAPVRPYTRGMAIASVSGTVGGYRQVGSTTQGVLSQGSMNSQSFSRLKTAAQSSFLNGIAGISVPTNLSNRVQTELLNKVARQDINLGNNAVELKSSIGMIAQRSIQLLTAFKAAKRLDYRGFFRALGLSHRGRRKGDTPSSLWLEYIYGWMPLCQDIYSGTQLVQQGFKEPRDVIFSCVRQLSTSENLQGDLATGFRSPVRWDTSATLRIRAKAWYRVRDEHARQFQRIGLTNPLQWAWEALPYSFVIDWFMPVGNFLQALSATQGLSLVDGVLSAKVTQNTTAGPIDPSFMSGISKENMCSNTLMYKYQAAVFQRWVLRPNAYLYVKSPFSSIHVFNAIALWTQLRRKG